MPSILFVDDEPNVLAGLRRMLRSRRGDWDMAFVDSGAAALQRLETGSTDVVVTDMRMPGMDGAELLTRVRQRHPDTVRIILSGHSDQEMTLRAIGPAHQYLAKPCEPDRLQAAIAAAIALHQGVRSPHVRRLVESVEALPSLPDVYVDLVDEMSHPNACIDAAGQIIARDLGMSAKILQIVNSSFFGLPVRVTDVPHAVALLGLGVIRPLVLSAGVFGQYEGREPGGVSLRRLTSHSLRVATLARELAETELGSLSQEQASDVLIAGLMHDVGRLVLAQAHPGDYAQLAVAAGQEPAGLTASERERFGTTHAEVGAYLLQLWGLPSTLVEAVARHHEPSGSTDEGFTALTAIHAAEVLTDGEADWDTAYLDRLGLTERIDAWSDETVSVVQ